MKVNAELQLNRLRIGVCLFFSFFIVSRVMGDATLAPSFEKEVLPILSENCFHCHGPDGGQRKAGLRLDLFSEAIQILKSGERAIVPGKPQESALLSRIHSSDRDELMPPADSDKSLTEEQKRILNRWVESGAEYEVHWAYRPIKTVAVPIPNGEGMTRNPIDAFVLAGLEREGVAPSAEASRYELIKRLYYDLWGLLPRPSKVTEFVSDDDPKAYERLVAQLMDSEHFGERWGRHWLDKARYADSDGYEKDNPRPNAWKYRDWVIRAINNDLPFDQFTVEQLAGDLLPDASDSQKLATAFHRQTLTNTEGGTDREQWRVAAVMDRTETTGSVWLGLTVGCARCHTHKYDPISHHEYYQMYAYFNNGDETRTKIAKSVYAVQTHQALKPDYDRQWDALSSEIDRQVKQVEPGRLEWEASLKARIEEGEEDDLLEALKTALMSEGEDRTDKQKVTILEFYHKQDPALVSLRQTAAELKKTEPVSPYLDVRVVTQRREDSRQTHVLERGEFTKPQDEVLPGVLAVLPPIEPREGSDVGDRLDFARWLVRADNPLTPRVIVNHIWSNLFGEGLVATRNDFGIRGETPSHPMLLDHLAREFVDRGWSRKELIRYIVMSATYRQSSNHREELASRDPKNRLLARQNRFRVEAEIVRDLHLDAAGLLSRKVGGPSVFPPTSKDVVALTYNSSVKWKVSPGENRFRRGIYTFFKRTAPHPNLMTFDCPDSNTTCVERNRSNTPLAALATLNNEVFVEAAKGFANRVLGQTFTSDRERMEYAFLLATVREAEAVEIDSLLGLLESARVFYQKHPDEVGRLLGDSSGSGALESASWTVCLRMVLNLDEVITRS
jgi:hypothetical protein